MSDVACQRDNCAEQRAEVDARVAELEAEIRHFARVRTECVERELRLGKRVADLELEAARLRAGMRQIAHCRNPNPCETCMAIARGTVEQVKTTADGPVIIETPTPSGSEAPK